MPHDPVTTSRIHLLCNTILSQPYYTVLKAPQTFIMSRELNYWDLDRLSVEVKLLNAELFARGFILKNFTLYLQPNGTVAIDGFEFFGFKMLNPDGSWYCKEPEN